jgi:hypothetical protein
MDRAKDSLMLRLSYSAYASLHGHDRRAGRAAVARALDFFGVGGTIEWFAVSNDHHRFNFALAFVVVGSSPSGTEYFVVVRGTNPLSLDSWVREDFDVATQVRWSDDPQAGKISQATATALSLHLGLQDKKTSLFTFLANRMADDEVAGRTSSVWFTGHSLGGLLAPVLALRFSETFPRFVGAVFHLVSFAAPTAGNSVFARHLERSFLERTRQNFETIRFLRCRDDVAVLVWNKRDLWGIVRLYGAYGVPINRFVLTVLAALRWRVRNLDYAQPFSGPPAEGRFRVPASEVFSFDSLDAESVLAGRLASQFHQAREVAKRPTSPRIFQKTLAWIVQAVVMHVVPYALRFLEPHEQVYVRETLLQTILTQDVLFTDRSAVSPPSGSGPEGRG